MLFAEILVVAAVLAGFAIGKWYEHGRRGGVAELQWRLGCARSELEQRRLATVHQFTPRQRMVGGR